MTSERSVLERLALHTEQLEELNRRQSEVNIFEILQVENREIRHSNILAWLLNPEESHGLGDSFLRGCIRAVIRNIEDRDDSEKDYILIDSNQNDGISNDIEKDASWWLTANFYKVFVEREREYKDIVITGKGRVSGEDDSGKDGFLIAIENKVNAKEGQIRGKKQTEVYYEDLMNPGAARKDGTHYSEFKKRMFVFLTPDGDPASDSHWAVLTYDDIVTALENAVNVRNVPEASEIVIRNYIQSIRRHIPGDPEIIELCDKMLNDEQGKAIDIILKAKNGKYEPKDSEERRFISAITEKYAGAIKAIEDNRSDVSYIVGQYIRKALRKIYSEGEYDVELPEKFNQKAYIKFTTKGMTDILDGPLKEPISPWRTKDKYYYEFDNRAQGNDKTKVSFFLTLGGGEFLQENCLLNIESQISALFGASLRDNYIYKRCPIPFRKKNAKVFTLKDREALEQDVEAFVRKKIKEAYECEAKIKNYFNEFNT